MPNAAPRHCPKPGHPLFTGKRCPECARTFDRARAQQHDQQRGNSAQRGYDATWRAFRATFIQQHPRCCEPACTRLATDVDHIVPLRQGGARLDPSNCRPMCHAHHSARTARDRARKG